MLAGLVLVGFATAQPEISKSGGQTIEIVRMRITAAGRDALAPPNVGFGHVQSWPRAGFRRA